MARRKKPPYAGKYLLTRFGGKGDALFLTAVAHQLKRRGYEVHVAINEPCVPLLQNNPDIAHIYPTVRTDLPPMQVNKNGHPVDLVSVDGASITVEALYERFPGTGLRQYNAANYRYVIESNSAHPWLHPTQNSDYTNTYDMHMGWAGIDPQAVTPNEKRPYYWTTAEERAWAKSVLGKARKPVIMVQTFASSPARTYYRLSEMVEWLNKNAGTVLVWYGDHWILGRSPLSLPKGMDGMRATAALIEQADLLVSADTCVSHLAEALQTRHLTYYSTVPAWTRSAYYEYETTVDCSVQYDNRICKCAIIGRDCPRRVRDAMDSLTDREKSLLRWLKPEHKQRLNLQHVPGPEQGPPPHERYGTSPQGFDTMAQAAATRYDGLRQQEAYCIASLDLLAHVKGAVSSLKGGD